MPTLASLLLAATLAASANDDSFGGAPAVDDIEEDGVCTIKDAAGVWRVCSDVLAAKEVSPPASDALVDHSPEAEALRERMKTAEAASMVPPVVAKTKLELELEKAHMDPTMPLLALRIELERAQDVVTQLETRGANGKAKDQAVLRAASAALVLEAIERIAIHRMDVCSQRRGNKPMAKSYRMTSGGAVALSSAELMVQLPLLDPRGCERITLIDAALVALVQRLYAVKHMLNTGSFGYRDVSKRRELEREQAALARELGLDAIPVLSAPGLADPYGL